MTEDVQNGVLILRIDETRLDAAGAPALRQALIGQVEAGRDRIVLDLSAVRFMDSSGLGVLVACLKRMGTRGSLATVGVQGPVARLFALTRMDRVFSIYDDIEAALAQMGN